VGLEDVSGDVLDFAQNSSVLSEKVVQFVVVGLELFFL